MPNDLFRQFNSGNGFSNQIPQNNIRSLFQNPMRLFQEFNRFRTTVQNPEQRVQQLLQSGEMSQSVYTQLGEIASEFQKLLPKF